MNNLQKNIQNYMDYCRNQKRLDKKTLKAYQIDLTQFQARIPCSEVQEISSDMLEAFIRNLHQQYKPKTVKRKIASVKALFHYFEYKDLIDRNPFNKIQVRFREPAILPRTIPLHTIETLLSALYRQLEETHSCYQRKNVLRDIAVTEVLFATGMRISELCSLKSHDVHLDDGNILIYGKGSKERHIQIENKDVIDAMKTYHEAFTESIRKCGHFFATQNGRALSDQSVRRMLNKYTAIASIDMHITPHMFRHTFATSLLEEDVDIRYIQEMLGHSSIHITEIYTHVSTSKQRDILATKHPRKNFRL